MLRILGKAWRKWIKFTEILGNIQMIILLSLIYWIWVTFLAIPFKLLSDPLALKSSRRSRWIKREPFQHPLESMRRQG